ncbi:MAG TPA: response regulator transcription factor [Opitutaceae bacterium]|nr:response regulator transcription factor [Opitutaceae bacterium]
MKPHPAQPSPGHPHRRRHRVLLIDDHPMMRAGLVQLINAQPDLLVCGETGTAAAALGLVNELHPDLIVTDLSLPGRSGLELVADLHTLEPDAAILVVSMHDEGFYGERALRAGARGYIMKDAGAKLLLDAMRRVLQGDIYLSAGAAARVLAQVAGADFLRSRSPVERLTGREFEVYRLIGEGKDSDTIARDLHLSRKTVDVHRGSIKKKLGLVSGTSLVHHAVRWREHEHRSQTRPETG